MLNNPPPSNGNSPSPWSELLEVWLARWQARRLARSYVRQGEHPVPSAFRSVDSVMMLNATGVVVILWLLLALPVWIIPFGSGFDSILRALLWAVTVATDVVIFGIPLASTLVYALVVPARRTPLQQLLASPLVLIGGLLAIWPAKIAVAVVVMITVGVLE